MNFHNFGINKGKVVYWVNNQRFENDEGQRNGKQKAINYCLENFIDTNEIIKFDSRTECNYYEYLLKQQELGLIEKIRHHYTILIQPEYINCVGDKIPPITYEADFVYKDKFGHILVEDVKGSTYFIDERFITLKQVFDNKFKDKNIYLRIIIFRDKQWVEYKLGEQKKSTKQKEKLRQENKELKAKEHQRQMEENKKQREIARLNELRSKQNLTKQQQKRLQELEERYKV